VEHLAELAPEPDDRLALADEPELRGARRLQHVARVYPDHDPIAQDERYAIAQPFERDVYVGLDWIAIDEDRAAGTILDGDRVRAHDDIDGLAAHVWRLERDGRARGGPTEERLEARESDAPTQARIAQRRLVADTVD